MAHESIQQTETPRRPAEPGGNSPSAPVILGVGALPCVGIVWGVRDGRGPLRLVIDRTLLAAAETYGGYLTHPRGHHEVWEGWRRLGPAGLARCGLPPLIAWHEYEHFPRGRVVFDTRTTRFTLYAACKLQAPAVLRRVLHAFGLNPARCDVRSDPHYLAVQDL